MEPPTTTTADSNPPPSSNPIPQIPIPPKLRLMCSYGGHIIPTPHEKSLRYIGGETRMVAVDRRSSLSSIISRLSSSLLHGRRNFTLKYQLPNEELDSLVSLSSDEDLENLIDEYDRLVATASSSSTASRLRIFIFFAKPETVASMGCLLDDVKSETWFVDALNGVSLLDRGLSESAVVDQLLDLDCECEIESGGKESVVVDAHEVFGAMSDSYVVENSSPSFGSSSSSPSMSNLPPIRVRKDEQVALSIGSKGGAEGYSDMVQSGNSVGEVNEFQAASEEERLDRSKVQVGLRKPPLPISLTSQNIQQQHKSGLPYNLPSPDSAASDKSIGSASSSSKLVYSQDPVQKESMVPSSTIDPEKQVSDSSPSYQTMQVHETAYLVPPQPEYVYSQQQLQYQQQKLHQLQAQQQQQYQQQQLQTESQIQGNQLPLSEITDQHPNLNSQNQRNYFQESLYVSSQQPTEHQQQQFVHPSIQQSYETTAVQSQVSEQLRHHSPQQRQNQFVTSSMQPQQQAYSPPLNQAEQLQEQRVQQSSQQQYVHSSIQYVPQTSAGQVPMPAYYSMYTTNPPQHQQLRHQTMYMLPAAQAQPYSTLSQSNNIPVLPNPSILPSPTIQTQMETTSSTLLMSPNPTLMQVPSSQNQQQYVSYSQFLHPAQSVAIPETHGYGYTSRDPQIYYTDHQHSSTIPQYQTVNSSTYGHAVASAHVTSQLPPADQHP